MITCGISIIGTEGRTIAEVLSKTLEVFRKEGYNLNNKVKLEGKGFVSIEGIGRDRRCAFCEYMRRALAQRIEKGEIALVKFPYNPDRAIDNTSETKEARKKLLEMFAKKYGTKVVN